MKIVFNIFIFIAFTITSCTSWKGNLKPEGNSNDTMIINAIYDFTYSSSLIKKHDVFSLRILEVDKDIIAVSIIGSNNKLFPTPNNTVGSNEPYFPTKYFELNENLFIWYDSLHSVTIDIISVLSSYNHIDSTNVERIVKIPEFIIDDSLKGIDYYFCRKNLLNYKKVKTSAALGYYKPPRLDCY